MNKNQDKLLSQFLIQLISWDFLKNKIILSYYFRKSQKLKQDKQINRIAIIKIIISELQKMQNTRTNFNQTGQSFGSNPASLKGKLQTLQQQIKNISNQLNNHKKEVQILRSEKDSLESVLSMKTADVKKSLSNELVRIEQEMKRHFNFQKAENSRIQQQITALKGQKTALQQQLLGLQRRITELQMQVGNDGQ